MIETEAVESDLDKIHHSKFRIFVEKGLQPETTEIRIIQIQVPKTQPFPEDMDWPETSQNQGVEKSTCSGFGTEPRKKFGQQECFSSWPGCGWRT